MIGQQTLLPSQTPYTVLDYGVTVLVLICMGIVLWFVFRTLAKVLADHARAMDDLARTIRMMKEELMTLVVDTRHLHESVTELQRLEEWDRVMGMTRREAEAYRRDDETG